MQLSTFFDRQHTEDFMMFSPSHWIALIIITLMCLLLYGFRYDIRTDVRWRQGVRLLLIIVLCSSEAGLQVWYISQNIWKSSSSLPLELCGITLLLSIIMLITRSRTLYSFLYFAGIGGAFIALLTPNLVYPFPHYRFLLFFIVHGAIILSSLYMTWIEGFKPNWKSLLFTMICLNIVAAFVWIANFFLGSNYMFLSRKPSTYSVLDYFGAYPYYLLVEELFAFIVFLLMLVIFFKLPARIKSKRERVGRIPSHLE